MENTEQKQRGYYAIIPAKVRYCKQLPILARMLYGELTALANEKGYCWASNAYFAELYEVSKDRISRLISMLEISGFISTEIITDPKTKVVLKRKIYIEKNLDSIVVKEIPQRIKNGHKPKDKKKSEGIVENNGTVEINNRAPLKSTVGIVENTKENNTPVNNTDLKLALKSFTNVQDFKAAGSESDAGGCPSVNVNFSEKTVSPCNKNPQSEDHENTPSFNKENLTGQASPQSQAESMSNSVPDTIPPDEAGGFPFADDDKPKRKAPAKRKSRRTTPDDTELDAYFATVDGETARRMHEITESLYRKSQMIDPRYIRNRNYLRNQTKKLTDYIATSGRTADEVEATFNFGFTDSFWCNVLTSVDTFLRNYAKIFRKMKDEEKTPDTHKYAGGFENSHITRKDYEEDW